MEHLVKLERRINDIYEEALRPLAERTGYDLPVRNREATGLPTVLFLGNHSSGKSSFINHLLGAEIQKTGVAPTDDGFTIITYGEKQDAFDGQTVVTHPALTYKGLERFGPDFLSRLRLKTVPHDLLKTLNFIDSPGMIDAAGTGRSRGYDFAGSVRHFAESADLILFFFDPDKPGTTGETVAIFTETLAGLEHKLLIVMHKVDLFPNIRDFARTYGTLCWNLSKTIKTKDIPHIYNTFLPGYSGARTEGDGVPLRDFEVSRDEVIGEIERVPTRRADNLVTDLYNHSRRLIVHAKVCNEVARRARALKLKLLGVTSLILALTATVFWLTRGAENWTTPATVVLVGLLLAAGAFISGRILIDQRRQELTSPEGLDGVFAAVFRRELAMHDRADLKAFWQSAKPKTVAALSVLGPEKVSRLFSIGNPLKRLEHVAEEEAPRLRRDIAEYHKSLATASGEAKAKI